MVTYVRSPQSKHRIPVKMNAANRGRAPLHRKESNSWKWAPPDTAASLEISVPRRIRSLRRLFENSPQESTRRVRAPPLEFLDTVQPCFSRISAPSLTARFRFIRLRILVLTANGIPSPSRLATSPGSFRIRRVSRGRERWAQMKTLASRNGPPKRSTYSHACTSSPLQ